MWRGKIGKSVWFIIFWVFILCSVSYSAETSLDYYKEVSYLEDVLAKKAKEAIAPILGNIPYFVVVKVYTKIKEEKEYKEGAIPLPGVYLHELLARYKYISGVRRDVLITKIETFITVDESVTQQQVYAIKKAVEGVLPFDPRRGDRIEIKRVPILSNIKKSLKSYAGNIVEDVKKEVRDEIRAEAKKELGKIAQEQEEKIGMLVEEQTKQIKNQLAQQGEKLRNKIQQIDRTYKEKIKELTVNQKKFSNDLQQVNKRLNELETNITGNVLPELDKQRKEIDDIKKIQSETQGKIQGLDEKMASVSEMLNVMRKEMDLHLKKAKEELSLEQKHIYFWIITALIIFLLITILLFIFSRLKDKVLRSEIESRFSLLKEFLTNHGVKAKEGAEIIKVVEEPVVRVREAVSEAEKKAPQEKLEEKEEERVEEKGEEKVVLKKEVNPFEFLNKISVDEILLLLRNEDVDVKAIVLSQLDFERATLVMEKLPVKERTELALKLGSLEPVDEVTYKKLAQRLADKLARMPKIKRFIADGKEYLVTLISSMEPFKQKEMLSSLKTQDPEMYKEIKRNHIFIDELLELPGEVLKEAFSMVDAETAAVLLYNLERNIVNRLLEFFPERRQAALREELLKLEENPPAVERVRVAVSKVLEQLNKVARRQGFLPREV
jgi:flagellar motor switch protein FliG